MEGLEERVLLREEMALVVPAGHRFAERSSVALAEAAGEDFVWVSEGATEAHPLYAAGPAAKFTLRIVCLSGSAQGMQSLVAAGLGISLICSASPSIPPKAHGLSSWTRPGAQRAPACASWRADRLSARRGPSLKC